jgi:undecaprenyl-diphosphatase
MAPAGRPEAAEPAGILAAIAGYARRLARRAGPALSFAFACIAVSLWGFGELAEDVLEGERFAIDEALLGIAHASAGPTLDAVFVALSAMGFAWGVIPADVLLVGTLFLKRRLREAMFAVSAIGGSALLNVVAKRSFRRERPAYWESIAPETSYSFPSAHAMGSATLGCVLVVLAWRTPARIPILLVTTAFVVGVGASRVYLGVHFPTDVLAGWAAACAWVAFCGALILGSRQSDGRRSST